MALIPDRAVERATYRDAAKAPRDDRLAVIRAAVARCAALERTHGIPFDFQIVVNESPDLTDLAPDVDVVYTPRGVPPAWYDLVDLSGGTDGPKRGG